MEEVGKLIFNYNMANYLLDKGFTIVKLIAHKDNPQKTVFVFRIEEGIREEIRNFSTEFHKIRTKV